MGLRLGLPNLAGEPGPTVFLAGKVQTDARSERNPCDPDAPFGKKTKVSQWRVEFAGRTLYESTPKIRVEPRNGDSGPARSRIVAALRGYKDTQHVHVAVPQVLDDAHEHDPGPARRTSTKA
jgi:hypothetical protein